MHCNAHTTIDKMEAFFGRFYANSLHWGLSTNDSCDCDAEQTADHITSRCRPIYRRLKEYKALVIWTLTHDHGSRTLTWTYEWGLMAHARRRRINYYIIQ